MPPGGGWTKEQTLSTHNRAVRMGIVGMLGAAVALAAGAGLNTATQSAAATPAPAAATADHTLADLDFLAGRWQSRDEGGFVEEHWSAPEGSSIMGMFRWVRPDGAAMMFEILTITQETDGLILRLRHFSPVLAAKEEKDKPMALRLTKLEANRAVFTAHRDAGGLSEIVYDRSKADTLAITVAFTDAARPPLEFALTREGSGK